MKPLDDLARNLTSADYERVSEQFVEAGLAVGITKDRIGFFGEIGCPGVSDIDAIAMGTGDQLRQLRARVEALREADRCFRYCFWHPPVYALDEIADRLFALHTLNNLRPLSVGRLSALTPQSEEQWLLSCIWFTFLLRCVSDMAVSPSLRWLLLLYRNFEHSLLYLSKRMNAPTPSYLPSIMLRQQILQGGEDGAALAASSFANLIEKTLPFFDRACAAEAAAPHSSFQKVIYGWNHCLYLSEMTQVQRGCVCANRLALDAAVAHVLPGQARTSFDGYVATARTVAAAYRRAEIPYPFVAPFGLPMSGGRRLFAHLATWLLAGRCP